MQGKSGREQLQGMGGRNKSTGGKHLSTPKGFGVVSDVFADMRRHYAGTWFSNNETQQSLRERATEWSAGLSMFQVEIVNDVMADFISTGNIAAPSLKTFVGMCEIKQQKTTQVDRGAVVESKNKAMATIRAQLN